jgi:hypothetical protein
MTRFMEFVLLLFAATAARATAPSRHTLLGSSRDYTGSTLPARVIFDHDGGVDDFITLMMLLSQPSKVEVLVSNWLSAVSD